MKIKLPRCLFWCKLVCVISAYLRCWSLAAECLCSCADCWLLHYCWHRLPSTRSHLGYQCPTG